MSLSPLCEAYVVANFRDIPSKSPTVGLIWARAIPIANLK
jgi:hypothetical protein